MNIDGEIRDLEHRIAQRRLKVELLARASGRRAVKTLTSPVGLLGAAALGFLAATGVVRRHRRLPNGAPRSKLSALAGLVLSAGFALLRAQFGSPVQMAQLVLSKLRKSSAFAGSSSRSDSRPAQIRR
jgi:hypothetical protein